MQFMEAQGQRMYRLLLCSVLLASIAVAQPNNPQTFELLDSGTSQGFIQSLDCTNDATCTVSGTAGTIDVTAGSGSPGGSNTQIQYNNAGAFGGASTFLYDGTNVQLNGGDFNIQDDDELQLGDTRDCFIYWDSAGTVAADTMQLECTNDEIYIQQTWRYNTSGFVGMDNTAPAVNQMIKADSAGSLRGALNFTYEYTGGSIGSNILSDITVSTNQILSNAMQSEVTLNNSLAFGTDTFLNGLAVDLGVDSALTTSTSKTYHLAGLKISNNNGNGAGSGASDVFNYYGLLIEDFTAITGSGTTNIWGINSAEPILVHDDIRIYLEGGATSFGDTYFQYDSTDTDVEFTVDGTQVLDLDNDQAQWGVTFSGGRNLFSAIASGTVAMSTTPADITWTEQVEDSYYTHAASAAGIQFNQDGLYRVHFDFYFDNTTGTTVRATINCSLLEDVGAGYVAIANSSCFAYTRPTADPDGSCSIEMLRDFNNTDDIKAQCSINNASATGNIDPTGTRMNIEFLRNS